MYNLKVIGFLLGLNAFFCNCAWENSQFKRQRHKARIVQITRLPEMALESSGLALSTDSSFWTHQDSGGKAALFLFDLQGQHLDTWNFSEYTKNRDWEDLAQDPEGNIYIGDIGNNRNVRQDLEIHKISPEGKWLGTIKVNFENQEAFPPEKRDRNFDMEAMVWHNDSLHIFSKNRGHKRVARYAFPDIPGAYSLNPLEEFKLNAMVTAGDISPDGSELALLAYGRIYLFKLSESAGYFDKPYRCIRFVKGGQAEALVYLNEQEILISNEKGKVFKLALNKNLR